jgi:activating signal cointegrator complex subunit 3
VAELALLRMKLLHPKGICVYIAPLKALARERLKEWQHKFGGELLKWQILELSGDTSYDQAVMEKSDILVCTPEKWDLISRGWRGFASLSQDGSGKGFVKRVRLLILDEVHLLGEDRGAVLEAIVSRTRFISQWNQEHNHGELSDSGIVVKSEATRIIGLSTALANPKDLADWIGIDTESTKPESLRGLYNFRPSVRPVPTKVSLIQVVFPVESM